MFTVYHSNRLDMLKTLLVDRIRHEPLADPFTDEQILVQSPGMAQWLRLELASSLGIAAGIAFPQPASFIWKMFTRVLKGIPGHSAFNRETMAWKIITLLPEHLDQPDFAPLRQYLRDDETGLRRYQLAEKIAHVYNRYLIYRPDWISAWEQGNDLASITGTQPWQPVLWRSLAKKGTAPGQPACHQASLYGRFIQTLQQTDQEPGGLPDRIFVFGISALPPHYVEALAALGRHCDVHLMVTSPCQYLREDTRDPDLLAQPENRHCSRDGMTPENCNTFSNPLLASMGKPGRDYLYQLQKQPATEINAFAEPSDDHTLLHILQADIMNLRNRDEQGQRPTLIEINQDDRSFMIHACYSALREVEILHDQLLALFQSDPALTPRDIVVMVPDIDRYSPFIQAVFGSTPGDRHIPWALSDQSPGTEYPLLNALMQLLTLDQHRCSAPELMELLETPAVMRRFSLDTRDCDTLRHWVRESGIRWGLDTRHPTGPTRPDHENTWLFGLQRMLLGYAMPQTDGLYGDILPCESIQGLDAALCGQLAAFIEAICRLVEDIGRSRSADDWIQTLNHLLDQFFKPDLDDERPLQLIRTSLENLRQQLLDAGYGDELSRDVLVEYLTATLDNERDNQQFLTGQVNFCTLMSMRPVPFKVVCLLGMNDGVYPRNIAPSGFDLIVRHPRQGDLSRRDDERYLFLETLLSAGDHFHISYVSRSITDNSERHPSVLVTELLNYCQQIFTLKDQPDDDITQWLITRHPLQPFSPDYFTPSATFDHQALFSFAREWLPAAKGEGKSARAFLTEPLPAEPAPASIELMELLRFYRNPCQYFCNCRLNVWFNDQDNRLSSDEPFNLNPLECYQLRESLLEDWLNNGNTRQSESYSRASGTLPHGNFGQLALDEQKKCLQDLCNSLKTALNEPVDDLEINLAMNSGIALTGWLKHCTRNGLVRFRPTRLKPGDRLCYWIEHLCYCACADTPASTRISSTDQQGKIAAVPADVARQHLEALVACYLAGLNEPQPLFPATSWAWLEAVIDDGAINPARTDRARNKAHAAYNGGFKHIGESENRYIQRIYPEPDDTIFERMTGLAETLFLPVYNAMEVD